MDNSKRFKAIFRNHGFDVPKDVSQSVYNSIRNVYVEMYNKFTDEFNEYIDGINDIWDSYEMLIVSGDEDAMSAAREAMDIAEGATYNDWIEKWMKIVADNVDKSYGVNLLEGNIFRDGDTPVYGVRFKDHPNWTIDFVLEKV